MLLRDEAGRPHAFAKIMRDDTARHGAEEELRHARDELVEHPRLFCFRSL
jgi:hypothetical protein